MKILRIPVFLKVVYIYSIYLYPDSPDTIEFRVPESPYFVKVPTRNKNLIIVIINVGIYYFYLNVEIINKFIIIISMVKHIVFKKILIIYYYFHFFSFFLSNILL